MLRDLLAGREWRESGHFPRVTLCDFEVRTVGNLNRYTVQCALLINLLQPQTSNSARKQSFVVHIYLLVAPKAHSTLFNEKVFTLIWLWLFFLLGVTVASAAFWCFNSLSTAQRR